MGGPFEGGLEGEGGVYFVRDPTAWRPPGFHKMTTGSLNAQFGWSLAATRGHNSTRRPSRERNGTGEEKKRAKFWAVRRREVKRRKVQRRGRSRKRRKKKEKKKEKKKKRKEEKKKRKKGKKEK